MRARGSGLRNRVQIIGRGRPIRRFRGRKQVDFNRSAVALVVLEFHQGHGLTLAAAKVRTHEYFSARGIRRVSPSQALKCYYEYFSKGWRSSPYVCEILDAHAQSVRTRVATALDDGKSLPEALLWAVDALARDAGIRITPKHARRLWEQYAASELPKI